MVQQTVVVVNVNVNVKRKHQTADNPQRGHSQRRIKTDSGAVTRNETVRGAQSPVHDSLDTHGGLGRR